jgi:hypothetical protein
MTHARLPVLVLACVLAAGLAAGCGGAGTAGSGLQAASGAHGQSGATTPSSTTSSATTPARHAATPSRRPAATVGRPAANGAVKEVSDPQEAESFPAPASVKHSAAAEPVKAGQAAVAAGAPSDAEVRRELQQMQSAERSAQRARQAQLTPVAGGRSVGGSGAIAIPSSVPEVVQRVIAGANEIADFPYVFGGGHASFVDNSYDCSGSVSYALAAGGLLGAPETSGELESWGAPGPGRYISVYANAGHTYMYVDGIMYNTAGRSGVYASRWQVGSVDNSGFVVRHPPGL